MPCGRCPPSVAARCSTRTSSRTLRGSCSTSTRGWLGQVALRRLANGDPMPVEPLYLRRPDALTTLERGAS